MAKWLKTIVFGVWVVLLLPLFATIFEKWLEQNFFSNPDAVATSVFDNLVVLSQERWFHFALVLFTGIVIGVSSDSLAPSQTKTKLPRLRHLRSFRHLAESIKIQTAFRSGWPDNIHNIKPDIVSALYLGREIGLSVPVSAHTNYRMRHSFVKYQIYPETFRGWTF